GLVPAIWSEVVTQSITPKAWLCAAVAGPCCITSEAILSNKV
ncbi:unnamed protein product, partial [marine sediment metagenome]